MWKWTSAILLVLLIGTNGWWLYQAIDLAVTEKYRQQEAYEDDRIIESLKAITTELVGGMSKVEFGSLLDRALPDSDPFETEGMIHVDFLSFPVTEDELVSGVR